MRICFDRCNVYFCVEQFRYLSETRRDAFALAESGKQVAYTLLELELFCKSQQFTAEAPVFGAAGAAVLSSFQKPGGGPGGGGPGGGGPEFTGAAAGADELPVLNAARASPPLAFQVRPVAWFALA
jgi:hypothetical protein